MKTLRFVAYLFFRYYSTGPTKSVSYFSTLCALVMLMGLHIFQLIILFNIDGVVPSDQNSRMHNFLITTVYLIPLFLLTALLVKRSDLEKLVYDSGKIKKGYFYLIAYIITSITVLVLLLVFKRIYS